MTVVLSTGGSEMAKLLKPYAGQELAPALNWMGRSGSLAELPHPSKIVRERSEPGDRIGEIYDRMIDTDTDLAGLCDKRRKAVLRLPRYIRPADSSPHAREIAAFVHQALSVIPQRMINMAHALEAIPKGVAIDELIWEQLQRGPLAGAWVPVDQIDRPMHRFGFSIEGRQLYIKRRAGLPIPAPPRKFLVHTYGTKDNPWGDALLNRVYWAWFLKRHAQKYWAIFVERFAQPLPIGKYKHRQDSNPDAKAFNEEQQARLLQAIEVIRTGTGLVIPEGLDLEYLEASRSGDASYQSFCAWLSRAQALILLGEIDTSGMAKGPGSFAKSQVSNDVRLETVQHDAHVLGTFESDSLVRWIVEVNFGPDAPAPKSVYDAMDATDREQRIRGMELALRVGERIPRGYFRMTTQLPDAVEGDEIIQPAAPASLQARPHPRRLALSTEDDRDLAVGEARQRDFDAVVEVFSGFTLSHFESHRERALALWDRGAVADGTFLGQLVETSPVVAHAQRLEAAQIHGMGWALLHLGRDQEDAERLSTPADFSRAITPATALEFWRSLLGIGADLFASLADLNRRFAFGVAGVTEAGILADLQRLVGRSIAEGLDRAGFVEALDEVYGRHGLTPTSRWHAELIYSNNVRQAAGAILYAQTVGNPQANLLTPYLSWFTLEDQVVRQRPEHNHAVVGGFTAEVNHPFWKTWWFPAGHGCRCGIRAISRAEARRRGLTGSEPSGPWPLIGGVRALPDPGFQASPDLRVVVDAVEQKGAQVLAQARDDGSAQLLQALLKLFALLGLLSS